MGDQQEPVLFSVLPVVLWASLRTAYEWLTGREMQRWSILRYVDLKGIKKPNLKMINTI